MLILLFYYYYFTHFYQDNAPVHNSILVTEYLTKIGIKTVPHPPYSRDLAPCDISLFPKLRGCRYERIEEIKEAETKIIDTFTQKDFHGAFQKLLERYNALQPEEITSKGTRVSCVYNEIKVPIRKNVWKLFWWSHIYIYLYIYIYVRGHSINKKKISKTEKIILQKTFSRL